ncbi:MAG: hypothetical protein SGI77_12790 [Pirellulaceae bacterium]|nr:hypothetical protein [Pirellulaceae bacterium]
MKLFRDEEYYQLLLKVSTELAPNALDVGEQWRSDFPARDGDTPSSHFEPLATAFRRYRNLFEKDNSETAALFGEACNAIDDNVRDMEENSAASYRESYSKPINSESIARDARSIFDGVDE